jgi:hypothetical protein
MVGKKVTLKQLRKELHSRHVTAIRTTEFAQVRRVSPCASYLAGPTLTPPPMGGFSGVYMVSAHPHHASLCNRGRSCEGAHACPCPTLTPRPPAARRQPPTSFNGCRPIPRMAPTRRVRLLGPTSQLPSTPPSPATPPPPSSHTGQDLALGDRVVV